MNTFTEKIFTIAVIICGSMALVLILGGITKAVTEGELRAMTEGLRRTRLMDKLRDHTIICGYGRMGQTLARELRVAGLSFVIIDRDEERIAEAEKDGLLALRGDATDEKTLETAGLGRAAIIATVLPQDALNVFITLTARNLSRTVRIIARGEQISTEKKLRQAGADEVVLPAQIGGLRIAHSITKPTVMSFLSEARDAELRLLGIEIDELRLRGHKNLVGLSVSDVQIRAAGSIFVLAVRRENGDLVRDDLDAVKLEDGDALIVIARPKTLPATLGSEVERTELL